MSELLENAKEAIRTIRKSRDPAEDRAEKIAKCILFTERKHNGFLVNSEEGSTFHFDGIQRKLYKIKSANRVNPDYGAFLYHRYGIIDGDMVARLCYTVIDNEARKEPKRKIQRFTWWDKVNNTLYVSRFDGNAYKLDGKSIQLVPNGQDVIFADRENAVPYEPIFGDEKLIRKTLVDDLSYIQLDGADNLSSDTQSNLLFIWLHTIPFQSSFGTRPILCIEGIRGSGKTVVLKRISHMLMGRQKIFAISEHMKLDDIATLFGSEYLAFLDNCDTSLPIGDLLAAATSGANLTKRQLFTDNDMVNANLAGVLAISSRDPRILDRDDLIDRTLLIRLNRREMFTPDDVLFKGLDENRNKLMGEWLTNLNMVVNVLQTPAEAVDHRLSEFVHTAKVIAKVTDIDSSVIDRVLASTKEEKAIFHMERSRLLPIIEKWSKSIDVVTDLSTGELFQTWKRIAEMHDIPWTFHTARSLAYAIRDESDVLYSVIAIQKRRGHDNTTIWRFTPHAKG
jgi:hypothetical protein